MLDDYLLNEPWKVEIVGNSIAFFFIFLGIYFMTYMGNQSGFKSKSKTMLQIFIFSVFNAVLVYLFEQYAVYRKVFDILYMF
jgi:hypothetical protein